MSAPAEAWDGHVHVFDGQAVASGAHYQAPACGLSELAAVASPWGVGRFLLVQPSVYGSNNQVLMRALAQQPGRHRGVVVLAGDETDDALDRMADAGVRGVRLNLMSPAGLAGSQGLPGLEGLLATLAPRLRARGWFLQWYAEPAAWPQITAWCARHRLVPVLDHLAGVTPDHWARGGVLPALAPLADLGGWLKLSGWYRLQTPPPYLALVPAIQALHRLFDGRCLWGSDWPHTRFMEPGAAGPAPPYASLLAPVQAALGEASCQALLHASANRLLR